MQHFQFESNPVQYLGSNLDSNIQAKSCAQYAPLEASSVQNKTIIDKFASKINPTDNCAELAEICAMTKNEAVLLAQIRSLQKSRNLMQIQLSSFPNILVKTQSTSSQSDFKNNNLKNMLEEFKLKQLEYMSLISQILNECNLVYVKTKTKLQNCKCNDLADVISKNTELNELIDELNKLKIEKDNKIQIYEAQIENFQKDLTNFEMFKEENIKTIRSLESKINARDNLISKFSEIDMKCKKLSALVQNLESEKSALHLKIQKTSQEHRIYSDSMQNQISSSTKEISNLKKKLGMFRNLLDIMSEDVSSIMKVYSLNIKDHEYVIYDDECLNKFNLLCKVVKILHPIVTDQQSKCYKINEDLLKLRQLSEHLNTDNNELQKGLCEALLQLSNCQTEMKSKECEKVLLAGRLNLAQQQIEKLKEEDNVKTNQILQLESRTNDLQLSLQLKEVELSSMRREWENMKQANDVFLDTSCISTSDKQIIKQLISENLRLKTKLELTGKLAA